MSEPFVGEIKLVGFSFAPRGYVFCNGALLAVTSQQALFALLGTTFGGNGTTTFGVPDFRGRVPVGMGQGPGLATYVQGEKAGVENITLLQTNMPIHTHVAGTTVTPSSSLTATTLINSVTGIAPPSKLSTPAGNVFTVPTVAGAATAVNGYAAAGTGTISPMATAAAATTVAGTITATAATTVQPAGGSLPFSLLTPYLGTNYIIATVGIFPSRN